MNETGDNKPKIATINSWADLARWVEELAHGPERIFRGVTNAKYDLLPKIGRPDTRRGRPYSPDLEKAVLLQFELEAIPYLESVPKHEAEWLFVAQHHGLPTRLLDWSKSPLVAAFFAIEQGGAHGDAAVYSVPLVDNQWEIFRGNANPFAVNKVLTVLPPHLSRRITAQHACFTIHPKPDQPYSPVGLIKAIIGEDVCLRLKQVLDRCGINRSTMMPGLDGISQDISWKLKWTWPAPEDVKDKPVENLPKLMQ